MQEDVRNTQASIDSGLLKLTKAGFEVKEIRLGSRVAWEMQELVDFRPYDRDNQSSTYRGANIFHDSRLHPEEIHYLVSDPSQLSKLFPIL